MSSNDIVTIRVPRRALRGALCLAVLLGGSYAIHGETLLIPTYLPSPSGVFRTLVTVGDTLLARDSGAVGIGARPGSAKLAVAGGVSIGKGYASVAPPADGLLVQGPLAVGARVAGAGWMLDVDGPARFSGGASFNDRRAQAVQDPLSADDGANKRYVDAQIAAAAQDFERKLAAAKAQCGD